MCNYTLRVQVSVVWWEVKGQDEDDAEVWLSLLWVSSLVSSTDVPRCVFANVDMSPGRWGIWNQEKNWKFSKLRKSLCTKCNLFTAWTNF